MYLFFGNRSHHTPKCINTIGKTHKLRFVANENFEMKQKTEKEKRTTCQPLSTRLKSAKKLLILISPATLAKMRFYLFIYLFIYLMS